MGWACARTLRSRKKCRRGVMEFLFINHPLDCPICDQAYECRLQEFSVDYGNASSRFLENKVKKPKNVELGPRVTLDDEMHLLPALHSFCQEIAARRRARLCRPAEANSVLTAHPGKRPRTITRLTPSIFLSGRRPHLF